MKNQTVEIIVRGPVGSGKSALLGEIEILMKAIGIKYRFADPEDAQSEKNATKADWTHWLELYEPTVVLVEEVVAPVAVLLLPPPQTGTHEGADYDPNRPNPV